MDCDSETVASAGGPCLDFVYKRHPSPHLPSQQLLARPPLHCTRPLHIPSSSSSSSSSPFTTMSHIVPASFDPVRHTPVHEQLSFAAPGAIPVSIPPPHTRLLQRHAHLCRSAAAATTAAIHGVLRADEHARAPTSARAVQPCESAEAHLRDVQARTLVTRPQRRPREKEWVGDQLAREASQEVKRTGA